MLKFTSMLLEELEAQNFRNLVGGIGFQPGLNILVGENGQGKTNWLEAIYLLASTRSFKTTKLVETVKFGEDLGIIRGRVRRTEEIHRDLQVTISKNIKSLWVNSKQIPAREYHGQLHAALFTSDALEIVRGGPDERRRFLDEIIVSIHPPYAQTVADHNRVIRQKNTLLQTAKDRELSLEETAEQLLPWNEQLAGLATRIHRSRVRIVERLNSELRDSVFQKEELTLHYISSLEGKGDLENYQDLITERLRMRVQAERAAGYALIGPHRDECEIRFDGRDIRKFGSSGQQRSALLSLQIANIAVFWTQQREYPLFLIDDIDAELDHQRIGQLLEFLDGKTQTIITTSKFDLARSLAPKGAIFEVSGGKASVSQSGQIVPVK